jgi:hypothetical protein
MRGGPASPGGISRGYGARRGDPEAHRGERAGVDQKSSRTPAVTANVAIEFSV